MSANEQKSELREAYSSNRAKDVLEAERTIETDGKEKPKHDDVEPSAFGIGWSYLKSGVNKLRMSISSDQKQIAELKKEEDINQKARQAMKDNYKFSNLVDDVSTVGTVVAVAALVSTGVGAGAGVALAARVAATQGVKALAKEGGKKLLLKSAMEVEKEVIKNTVRTQSAKGVGELLTSKFMQNAEKLLAKNGGSVLGNFKTYMQSAYRVTHDKAKVLGDSFAVASRIRKGISYVGIPLTLQTMGKSDLDAATKKVANREEIHNLTKRYNEQQKENKQPVSIKEAMREYNKEKYGEKTSHEYRQRQIDKATGNEKPNDDRNNNKNTRLKHTVSQNTILDSIATTKQLSKTGNLNSIKQQATQTSLMTLNNSLKSIQNSLIKHDDKQHNSEISIAQNAKVTTPKA